LAHNLGHFNFIERDPIFEDFRTDPEFRRILENVKLKAALARKNLGI
jgi:hypothetical protein